MFTLSKKFGATRTRVMSALNAMCRRYHETVTRTLSETRLLGALTGYNRTNFEANFEFDGRTNKYRLHLRVRFGTRLEEVRAIVNRFAMRGCVYDVHGFTDGNTVLNWSSIFVAPVNGFNPWENLEHHTLLSRVCLGTVPGNGDTNLHELMASIPAPVVEEPAVAAEVEVVAEPELTDFPSIVKQAAAVTVDTTARVVKNIEVVGRVYPTEPNPWTMPTEFPIEDGSERPEVKPLTVQHLLPPARSEAGGEPENSLTDMVADQVEALMLLTKRELRAMCSQEGIITRTSWNKSRLVDALVGLA